ncbi:MAG TPA: DUF4142 domain-containing protein [Dokdonella sp.]
MNALLATKLTIAALALFAASALAQDAGNPAARSPQSAHAQPNDADRLFVQQAAIGGKAEVELGELAARDASDEEIKSFAQRMVAEHGEANRRLAGVAGGARVPVPDALDADHRVMADDLRKRRGADFDVTYVRGQISGHQRTAQLLEWEIGAGQDPALKEYAKQTLPTVLDHLEHAQRLQQRLAGPSGATAVEAVR